MKCSNCGNEIDGSAKFCVYCGSKVEAVQAAAAYGNFANNSLPQQQNVQRQPITRETRYTPAGESGSSKPAVALMIIYGALGLLAIVFSLVRAVIAMAVTGAPSEYMGTMFRNQLPSAAIGFLMLILSLIPILIVVLARRKYLWKVKPKDVVIISIFMFVMWLESYIEGVLLNQSISSNLGSIALVGYSVASQTIALISLTTIINGIALSLFILARSGAKVATFILGGGAAVLALFLAVIGVAAPITVLRMFSYTPDIISIALVLTRIGSICRFFASVFILISGACYGFASPKSKRWIPVYLIVFLGQLVLSWATMFVGLRTFGINAIATVYVVNAIAWLACAMILLFGAIKNRRAA